MLTRHGPNELRELKRCYTVLIFDPTFTIKFNLFYQCIAKYVRENETKLLGEIGLLLHLKQVIKQILKIGTSIVKDPKSE